MQQPLILYSHHWHMIPDVVATFDGQRPGHALNVQACLSESTEEQFHLGACFLWA